MPREDFQRSCLEQVASGRAVHGFKRSRAYELQEPADGARTLSFAAPDAPGFLLSTQQEPADMGLTLLFHTLDAPGFLLSAQQEPADKGQTLLFHTPDAPGFLLSWKIIKLFE